MSAVLKQEAVKHCEECGVDIPNAGPYTSYCDPCRTRIRAKGKKYKPTEYIDSMIRKFYSVDRNKQAALPKSFKDFAAIIKWPVHALRLRARQLGVAKTKERPWTARELSLLQKYSWMSDVGIQRKFAANGYTRTAMAIHIKLKRMRYKQNNDTYTAHGLSVAMGCDAKAVTRWINLGYLKGQRRGTERTAQQGGDMYVIFERDVREFLVSYPNLYDLGKVDKFWFLDLITQGKIAETVSEAVRA